MPESQSSLDFWPAESVPVYYSPFLVGLVTMPEKVSLKVFDGFDNLFGSSQSGEEIGG